MNVADDLSNQEFLSLLKRTSKGVRSLALFTAMLGIVTAWTETIYEGFVAGGIIVPFWWAALYWITLAVNFCLGVWFRRRNPVLALIAWAGFGFGLGSIFIPGYM